MSCSEQTRMRLCFSKRNNNQYFKTFRAKLRMNNPVDVNKHQWSWSPYFLFASSQALMVLEQQWLAFSVLVIVEKTIPMKRQFTANQSVLPVFTVNKSKNYYEQISWNVLPTAKERVITINSRVIRKHSEWDGISFHTSAIVSKLVFFHCLAHTVSTVFIKVNTSKMDESWKLVKISSGQHCWVLCHRAVMQIRVNKVQIVWGFN